MLAGMQASMRVGAMPYRGLLNLLKMFLVSGGAVYDASYLDSTEIFDPELGNWRAGAALPSKRQSLSAANIDGRVLIFGIKILFIKTCSIV